MVNEAIRMEIREVGWDSDDNGTEEAEIDMVGAWTKCHRCGEVMALAARCSHSGQG